MKLVISDVDGSMISYDGGADGIAEAIERLLASGISLVLSTTKTAEEVSVLWRELAPGRDLIAVIEAGGAICSSRPLWESGVRLSDLWCVELGERVESFERDMLEALRGCSFVRLSQLSPREVGELLMRPAAEAALAMRRRYVEVLWSKDMRCLEEKAGELERRGLTVLGTDRFFHVCKHGGKEGAMRVLLRHMRPRTTIGVGDSSIDRGMLEEVERAIVIPKEGGRLTVRLRRSDYIIAPYPAPAGWVWASKMISLGLI